MKKKFLSSLLVISVVISLIGCGAKEQNDSKNVNDNEVTASQQDEIASEDGANEEADAIDMEESKEVELPPYEADEYDKKYAEAMEKLYYGVVLPDDSELIVSTDPSFGLMEDNLFAIADVDGDGIKELIISITTAPMAGMVEYVYQYDIDSGTFIEEMSTFPALSFYTDGLALCDWSHNQGFGEMWPYTILEYNKGTNEYETVGQIDSWDKARSATDWSGNAYPEDLDEGKGVIYSIFYKDKYDGDFIYSQTQYDEFYEKLMEGKEQIEVQYHSIGLNEIDMLKEGRLDPVIIGKTVEPMMVTIDEANLADGIYSVAIDPYSIYDDGEIFFNLYVKEIYDIGDMHLLERGDGIRNDGELYRVDSISEENGGIIINGGIEQGGLEFRPVDEDNCYVYNGFDGYATYTKYGLMMLDMAKDCIITDKSSLDNDGVNVKPSDFSNYAKNNFINMTQYNTNIRVENGEIVEITINYMP